MPRHTTPRRRRGMVITAGALALGLAAGACSSADLQEGGVPDAAAAASELTMARVEGSADALDEIVTEVMADTGVPGVAVGVVFDDQVVISEGFGVTAAGTDDPVDDETVFQLASLSKPVSSTAIAGAVGDGDLEWDDTVVTYLPDFALSDEWVTDHVTVADLYSHRSGLPGSFAGNDLENMGFDQATIVERLRWLPLNPFRSTYEYSNFGMTAGGLAAAEAAGTTFPELMQEELFGPAGMTSTSALHSDYVAADDRALLHARVDGEFQPAFERQPDAQAPAGGVSSNVVDLNRWMRLQLADGMLDGTEIIDAEALAETHRGHVNNRPGGDPAAPGQQYGLGWNVGQAEVDESVVLWSHSGAFSTGAATTVRLLPELGLGVVVLTNAQPIGAAEGIADAYLDTLLHGSATQDWPATWGERMVPLLAAPDLPELTDTSGPRDAAAYVGTYENDYYGTVVISEVDGELVMTWGPDDSRQLPLVHHGGDVFLYADFPEIADGLTPLAFEFGEGDEASTLVLGGEVPLGDWMVMARAA